MDGFDQRQQFAGMRVAVVDAVEHDVLKRNEIARCLVQITLTGSHQCFQRIFLVDRHQLVAQLVVRRMQRDGQGHGAFVAQAIHHGHQTRGGHRNATARKAVSVIVQHQPERGNRVLEIGERLTHAHQHDVGNNPFVAMDRTQCVVGHPELADNFRDGQVAVEALLAG